MYKFYGYVNIMYMWIVLLAGYKYWKQVEKTLGLLKAYFFEYNKFNDIRGFEAGLNRYLKYIWHQTDTTLASSFIIGKLDTVCHPSKIVRYTNKRTDSVD